MDWRPECKQHWSKTRSAAMCSCSVAGAATMIKVLWWSGDGLCLLAKRLERGRFVWPQATNGTVSLSQAQLSMLLEGIDWRRPERTWKPSLAL